MTLINGVNVRLANNQPFTGELWVTLPAPITRDGVQVLPWQGKVVVTSGNFTLDLVPSEDVAYTFSFQEVVNDPGDDTVTPVVPPSTTYNEIHTFSAKVPDWVTPVPFSDLMQQTGISSQNYDASILAVTKRLVTDDVFWSRMDDEILPAKGVYSNSVWYSRGDIVLFDGSSYRCVSALPVRGVLPTDTESWVLFAAKGDTGTGTLGNDEAYDASSWNGATDAPSRNTVRDLVENLPVTLGLAGKANLASPTFTGLVNVPDVTSINDSSNLAANTRWVQSLVDVVKRALTPIGAVVAFGGGSAPQGWLLCDGRTLSRTTYSDLFTVLGTSYNIGGEDGTVFRLPDLRGRVVAAPDTSALTGSAGRISGLVLGSGSGSSTNTLVTGNLPPHQHMTELAINWTDGTAISSNSQEYLNVGLLGGIAPPTGSATGGRWRVNTSVGFSALRTSDVGSSVPFSVLQPSLCLNYIIFTGV